MNPITTCWTACFLLLICGGTSAQMETFGHAEATNNWTFTNGPEFPGAEGQLAWNKQAGHVEPGCLDLHYSFTGGGNYVQARRTLPMNNDVQAIRLWLKKPGAHRITFRATDSTGQTFQKSLEYTFDDWQQVEVDLDQWPNGFGGPNDGTVRPPMQSFGVLLENTCEPREGILQIDDLEPLRKTGGDRDKTASTYVACDFASDHQWKAAGGPGNGMDLGIWTYAFHPGSVPPSLNTDISLLGHPTAMRIVLETSGIGHTFDVLLGSHFQNFRRRIESPAKAGAQVIDIPLDTMKGWQHYGGQNDGQARLPLRLRQIQIHQDASAPAAGTIRLHRIEVDTRLPDGQQLLIVPDAIESDGVARFSAILRNLGRDPVQGMLSVDLRDLGGTIRQEQMDLALPPGGTGLSTPVFEVALETRHFAEAVFRWTGSGPTVAPVSIGLSTQTADAGSSALRPDSPIGVGLYLYRWNGHPTAHENMTRLAGLARRAGVKWTREEFNWGRIELQPGRYNWDFYDDMVDVAMKEGISVYGLLCYWSGYASANTNEGIDQYCRFVQQVVRRYKNRIKHWEIWNEPNIFFWTGPREMYPELLARAYRTIKEEDAEAQVLGCSTSGIDTDFIRMVMDRGGRFDALTIHPYRHTLNDVAYMEELRTIQSVVDGLPVWITEIGFPTPLVNGRSEREQASLVARVYLTSLASGAIRNVSWYDFRNDGTDPFYHEMNFGLVRNDLRLKPGYRALATVAEQLGRATVLKTIDVGSGAYAFRFRDERNDTVAVCSPDAGRILTFTTDTELEIVNAFGEPVAPTKTHDRLSLTLDAGFPVYFAGPKGFGFSPTEPAASLIADQTSVRPGDEILLHIAPNSQVITWQLPPGWPRPQKTDAATYRLTVPARAAPGRIELQTLVDVGGALRVPIALFVQPAILRV